MKCYYEVLDVPRDADDAQIKSAYRKLALKWHPDKNLDNTDFAKEQFQVVQQAYEVLSDRQERAWYDKHREQIIRGASSEFQDNSLDVFQYFTTACFKGYGDDEDGFYAVYRRVFEKIAKEDMEFMNDKKEFCEIPNFGNSTTSFEKVSEFYAYWSNYSTKKSYVWLDPYDIKDIKERRYLRLVEKENKKVRQAAKKERNEEVRNLVAFVRKRDKRVQAQKKAQELKSLENKKKTEELRKQKKLERQEELNNSKEQPEWAKFDNVKSELEEIEKNLAEQFGEEQSESDDEDINNLYCVACTKLFKTPKAFQNHESSKKHKENVELLKQQMLIDEELNGECDDLEDYNDNEDESNSDIDKVIEDSLQNKIASESDDLGEIERTKLKQKKKQKSVIPPKQEPESYSEVPVGIDGYSSDDLDFMTASKSKKKNKKKSSKLKEDLPEVNGEPIVEADTSKPRKMKKETKGRKKEVNEDLQNMDLNHNCVSCKSSFPSKNKLFDHLKKTGHGVYIPPGAKSNKKKSNKEN